MSLYDAAQAMTGAYDYAGKLVEQIDTSLTYQAPLRRETGRLHKALPHGPLKDEAREIDNRATKLVDDIRQLQTDALELSGLIKRLGEAS